MQSPSSAVRAAPAAALPSDGRAPSTAGRRGSWIAALYAGAVAASLGYFLLGIPIQVSDSFGNMLKLSMSWPELMANEFTQQGFLRPFLWAELKLVYDLSAGDYTPWFRWTHVVELIAVVALYTALVRPRTWRDAACLPLGLGVLVGIHTFTGTVREAFPINTFLTLLICCFAAAGIALARHRWWNDVAAVLLFVVAALTVESGLLVWVIVVGAAIVGARGVSRVGIAALVVLLGAYFVLRFAVLDIGGPGLIERSSGFGFAVLEPAELQERFGDNPLPFYLYNIAASALSVLFSEPVGGVFRVTEKLTAGELPLPMAVNVISSGGVALLIAAFAWVRRRAWLARQFDRDDRLVLLFLMVLAANAVISYPYVKDTNMTPAGAFLAVAAFAAARHLFAMLPVRLPGAAAVALASAALIVSSAWALRVVGLHHELRRAAFTERLDWAYIESSVAEGDVQLPDAAAASLMRVLRDDALIARPAPPPIDLSIESLLGIED